MIDVAFATSRQRERRLAQTEVGVFTLVTLFTASGHANLTPAAYAVFAYTIARLVLFSSADGDPPRHLLVPVAAFAGLTLHTLRTGTAELESMISQALLGALMLLASYYAMRTTRFERGLAAVWMGCLLLAMA